MVVSRDHLTTTLKKGGGSRTEERRGREGTLEVKRLVLVQVLNTEPPSLFIDLQQEQINAHFTMSKHFQFA